MTLLKQLLALAGLLLAVSCFGATWNSPTPSYADVSNTCYNVASPGDTVLMPAGSATWTTALWLPLGVSLLGSGTNSTIIINDATPNDSALINAVNTADNSHVSLSTNYLTRISNFRVDGGGNTSYSGELAVITIGSGVDNQPVQWRIDHLFFNTNVCHQIIVWNKLGLVDHCCFLMNSPNQTFQAGRAACDLQTDSNYSWSIPCLHGTVNSLVVEANVFYHLTPNSQKGVVCDIPEG